jgi:hypothetical protein
VLSTPLHPIPPNNNTPNLAQIETKSLGHEVASSNALQVMCRQQWWTLLPLSLYKVALYSPWSLHWMEEQFGTQLNPPRLHTLEISLDPLAAVTPTNGEKPISNGLSSATPHSFGTEEHVLKLVAHGPYCLPSVDTFHLAGPYSNSFLAMPPSSSVSRLSSILPPPRHKSHSPANLKDPTYAGPSKSATLPASLSSGS